MNQLPNEAERVKLLSVVRDAHDLISGGSYQTHEFRRVQECLAWLVAVEADIIAKANPADKPDA